MLRRSTSLHRVSLRRSFSSSAHSVSEVSHRVRPYNNKIAAVQHGDMASSKALILAVHGLCDSASSFDLLAPYLVDAGFCVFAIDLPGHGESDWTGRYAYIDLASDIYGWIQAAGIHSDSTGKPLMALSHSFGAETSACLACIEPALFAKLCLIECTTFPP